VSSLDAPLTQDSLAIRLTDRATLALALLLVLGIAGIWAAPRPMMVDLPQHAGQIAVLHDMILGRSPWSGELRLNLLTPYLIGYGLALPLSFVMSAAAALKVVLSAAYVAFVGACIGIGRELGASRKLDAYYTFSFFGFAFSWGMYTFLVAAPVGLAFIWLCIRYARQGLLRQGLGVAALGAALLLSHGLVFLFACGVGGLVLAVRARSLHALARSAWPFWLLLAICAVFFLVTREREAAINPGFGARLLFGSWQAHVLSLLANAFDVPYTRWPLACFPIFVGLPLLAGFRPDWRARESAAIALAVLVLVAFGPDYAWSTSMLFERFALFLPAAFVWLLREAPPAPGSLALRLQPRLGFLAVVASAGVLAQHAQLAIKFGHEQRDFETVLAAAQPGQRALGLIFDPASHVDHNLDAYLHHAVWYQAEKHGFVDFNFAAFHPQIARFRPSDVPPMDQYVAQDPRKFDWRTDQGDRYRYIFVRSSGPTPPSVFAGARCSPVELAAAGEWRLYERRACD
jgi:hypothetical protein